MTDKVAVTQEVESLRERVARWDANPSRGSRVTVPLGELRAVLEAIDTTRIATAEACARIADRAEATMKAQGSLCAEREFHGAAECAAEIATAIRLQQGSEKP